MAMADFMGGRWPSHKSIPVQITEFMIAKEFGYTLEYIRSMNSKDYEVMTLLLDIYNRITAKNKQKQQVLF